MKLHQARVVDDTCEHGRMASHGYDPFKGRRCQGPESRSMDMDDLYDLMRETFGEGEYIYIPLSQETRAKMGGGEMP